MKFDKIIANPPFRQGSSVLNISFNSLKSNGKAIVVCPIANLMRYKHYKFAYDFEPIDSLFDADITKNLGVISLNTTPNSLQSYSEFEKLTFDKTYKDIYDWNWKHRYLFVKETKYLTPADFNFDTDFIESCRLPSECQAPKANGYAIGNNIGYRVNVKNERPSSLPNHLCVIHFPSKLAKDNFSKWAYSDKSKNNLANNLIFGLRKQSVSKICACAIPQINWETISSNPLWSQNLFDSAVLSIYHPLN